MYFTNASHPLRVRGLKLDISQYIFVVLVASFTGAWIETFIARDISSAKVVASFTGAWIETY